MPEHRTRHIAWPVILVAVGLALLLDQLGVWSLSWSHLWRLWPVVLILVGLDILLTRTRLGSIVFLIVAGAIIVLAAVFLQPARVRRGGLESEVFDYPRKGIESAKVQVEMGVGKLTVSSLRDSPKLFEAQVSYDKGRTQVISDVDVHEDEARVRLRSRQGAWMPLSGDLADEWRVGLSPDVPMRVDIEGGVSEATLDLSGLELTYLDLDMGVGSVDLLLSEKGPYEASIDGGVGRLDIEIPREVEARVRVDAGLGSVDVGRRYQRDGKYYVTREYKSSSETIDVYIDGGIGSITIR